MANVALPVPPKEELVELRKTKKIDDIAQIYFVHPTTVSKWLREYGLTKRKLRVISDEEYAIAVANGIDKRIAYRRVNKMGWSIKEAITTKPLTENEIMQRCAKGRDKKEWPMHASKEQYSHAKSIGLTKKHVDNRIRYGWTVEEATTIPVIPYGQRCKGRKVYKVQCEIK